jgi:hypothetical protein
MTIWEKLKTGPRHTLCCRSCGGRVSISRAAIFAVVVPVAIGAFVANASASLVLGAAAIMAGGVAAVWVYIYAVPVVRRDA